MRTRIALALIASLTGITLVGACGGMGSGPDAAESSAGVRRAVTQGSATPASAAASDGDGGAYAGGYEGGDVGAYEAAEAPPSPSGGEVSVTTTTTTTTTVTVDTLVEAEPSTEPQYEPQASLTAASVGDMDRRGPYLDYLARHRGEANALGLRMDRRLRFRVVDATGRPVNDAGIVLHGVQTPHQVRGRTHADGIWDFYPSVSLPNFAGDLRATITAGQVRGTARVTIPRHGDGQEITLRLDGAQAQAPRLLDLAFLIDVTGSMEDELRYVNREVTEIVHRVREEAPETQVRVGATFYRDRTDRHVVQQIPFTENITGFAQAMRGIRASGGGDYPEDLNAGLDAALSRLQWREGNTVRVLVVIADAPPKRYGDAQFTYHHAMIRAAAQGIRILPVAASGADRTVEYLFRAMGAFTSTPYVYLTDDSGIGNPHMEADTDRVAVEYFNDLLTRLVVSDLRGHGMHEPGQFAAPE
ncbi:MAG: vWA domain-containing protein [Myxococcota bacterium]